MVNQNEKLEYNQEIIDDLAKTLDWGELINLYEKYRDNKDGLDIYIKNREYLNEINRNRTNNIVEEDIPIPENISISMSRKNTKNIDDVEEESQLFNGELKRKIRI